VTEWQEASTDKVNGKRSQLIDKITDKILEKLGIWNDNADYEGIKRQAKGEVERKLIAKDKIIPEVRF
jgi:endonuclease III-like uncharacterized protein